MVPGGYAVGQARRRILSDFYAVTEAPILGRATLPGGLTEDDLHTAYNTTCDPRLNYEQAMEIAFAIAGEIGKP